MRDTNYAREIKTVSDQLGQRIERIYVKSKESEEIRFSWWPEGRMANRPLDIPESELLELMRVAFRNGVFSLDFMKNLHEALYEERPAT